MFKRNNRILFKFFIVLNLFVFSNNFVLSNQKNNFFKNKSGSENVQEKLNFDPEEYIFGPGDEISIVLKGIPELSGKFYVGPGGDLYLPELKNIKAEGLTLNQLDLILLQRYEKTVKNPELNLRITRYRPIRVFVHGEVVRPGFYSISGGKSLFDDNSSLKANDTLEISTLNKIKLKPIQNTSFSFPTLYDSLKAAQGVTPYSNLSEIYITRNSPKSEGTKIIAKANILSLFKDGDQSQNIRIFDNDVIEVKRSDQLIPEQLNLVRKSNLNPDYNVVYVSGMVEKPGLIKLPKGAGLNQAIESAGGKKLLSGRIRFLRYRNDGEVDKRQFNYNLKAKLNSYKNPILIKGDIINVRDTAFGKGTRVFSKVTDPLIRIYSVYKIFD
tara:strand:+ start:2310 stop:3461 length:1152 start_codon:yes stop_codon:yes gene_type:complete